MALTFRHKRYCQNHLVTIDHKTDHFWISGLCGWSHKFCMTLDNPFIPSLGLCMVCFMAFSARNSKKDGLKTVSQPLALLSVCCMLWISSNKVVLLSLCFLTHW